MYMCAFVYVSMSVCVCTFMYIDNYIYVSLPTHIYIHIRSILKVLNTLTKFLKGNLQRYLITPFIEISKSRENGTTD